MHKARGVQDPRKALPTSSRNALALPGRAVSRRELQAPIPPLGTRGGRDPPVPSPIVHGLPLGLRRPAPSCFPARSSATPPPPPTKATGPLLPISSCRLHRTPSFYLLGAPCCRHQCGVPSGLRLAAGRVSNLFCSQSGQGRCGQSHDDGTKYGVLSASVLGPAVGSWGGGARGLLPGGGTRGHGHALWKSSRRVRTSLKRMPSCLASCPASSRGPCSLTASFSISSSITRGSMELCSRLMFPARQRHALLRPRPPEAPHPSSVGGQALLRSPLLLFF